MKRFSHSQIKQRIIKAFELKYLRKLLKKNKGNVSKSAREAKLNRPNFNRLLRKYNIKPDKYRKHAITNNKGLHHEFRRKTS